jgi:hypothetical protein
MNIAIPDLTAAETKGLQRATNDYNALVASQTPPEQTPVVLTPVQYLRQRIIDLIQSYVVLDTNADKSELATAYQTATDAQRQAARTALGLP